MKNCHVCNFECEDNAELCPVCGADLNREVIEEVSQVKTSFEPILLATFEDVVSAEIFKDILNENEIAYSNGEGETSIKVLFGGGFAAEDIYVDKSDFEKAEALYNEFLETEPQFEGEFLDLEEE